MYKNCMYNHYHAVWCVVESEAMGRGVLGIDLRGKRKRENDSEKAEERRDRENDILCVRV